MKMSDDNGKIENFTARQFQRLRGELEARDATIRAEIGRVHSELSEVKADMARLKAELKADVSAINTDIKLMHADVISTRSLVLDAIVQLTSLKNRVIDLEDKQIST